MNKPKQTKQLVTNIQIPMKKREMKEGPKAIPNIDITMNIKIYNEYLNANLFLNNLI